MWICALSCAASQAAPLVTLSAGGEGNASDPFTRTPQLVAEARVGPGPYLSLGLRGAYGLRGPGSWYKALVGQLPQEPWPRVPQVLGSVLAVAHVTPLSGYVGSLPVALGVHLGVGAVWNQELWMGPSVVQTDSGVQRSVMARYGLEGSLWRERVGLGLELSGTQYRTPVWHLGQDVERRLIWIGGSLLYRV